MSLRLIAALGALALAAGCVERSLTIRTDPPGAQVFVNDELKGDSPVTFDPVWYGWQRVSVRKDGYDRVDERKRLRAPVYLWIPFDLAMELMPFTVRDHRAWSYSLAKAEPMHVPTPPEPLPVVPAEGEPAQAPPVLEESPQGTPESLR